MMLKFSSKKNMERKKETKVRSTWMGRGTARSPIGTLGRDGGRRGGNAKGCGHGSQERTASRGGLVNSAKGSKSKNDNWIGDQEPTGDPQNPGSQWGLYCPLEAVLEIGEQEGLLIIMTGGFY